MADEVWLVYEGESVFVGTVPDVQSLNGSERETVINSPDGKAMLYVIGRVITGVVEELLYDVDSDGEAAITVEIK